MAIGGVGTSWEGNQGGLRRPILEELGHLEGNGTCLHIYATRLLFQIESTYP